MLRRRSRDEQREIPHPAPGSQPRLNKRNQCAMISGTHGSADGLENEKQNRADPVELSVHVSEERYRRLFNPGPERSVLTLRNGANQ